MARSKTTESKEKARVRIETDIQAYIESQSERVLGKAISDLDGADLTTLVNRLIYEHKLGWSMASQVPLARLFNWVIGLVPGNSNKVVALQAAEQPGLQPAQQQEEDDFSFEAEFATQFEDAA
ncbi:hypothetical protein NDI49_27120 [Trichocoleus sp. ST-U3]